MPKGAYPTGTDLQNALMELGLAPVGLPGAWGNIDFDSSAHKGVDLIENATGRNFLGGTPTPITAPISAGVSLMPVFSSADYVIGDLIAFDVPAPVASLTGYQPGPGLTASVPVAPQEVRTVDGIPTGTSLHVSAPTAYNHAAGAIVTRLETRLFDPPISNPSGRMGLPSDLCSTSPVYCAVSGVQQRGGVYGPDFFLRPQGNDRMKIPRPWTWVEFQQAWPNVWVPNQRESVAITGVWAFSTQIPDMVWYGMLQAGLLEIWSSVLLLISGGKVLWRRGDDEQSYGGKSNDPLQMAQAGWASDVQDVLNGFTRKTGWLT